MRFKLEVALLSVAIALFAVSSFIYSYQTETNTVSLLNESAAMAAAFPFRMYAVSFVGFGSVLMVAASISYQKKSKQIQSFKNQAKTALTSSHTRSPKNRATTKPNVTNINMGKPGVAQT